MTFIRCDLPVSGGGWNLRVAEGARKLFAQSGVNVRSDSCEPCAGKFRNFQRNSHFSLHRMQQNVSFFSTGAFSGRVFGSLATGALATTSLETNKTKTTKENTYED